MFLASPLDMPTWQGCANRSEAQRSSGHETPQTVSEHKTFPSAYVTLGTRSVASSARPSRSTTLQSCPTRNAGAVAREVPVVFRPSPQVRAGVPHAPSRGTRSSRHTCRVGYVAESLGTVFQHGAKSPGAK